MESCIKSGITILLFLMFKSVWNLQVTFIANSHLLELKFLKIVQQKSEIFYAQYYIQLKIPASGKLCIQSSHWETIELSKQLCTKWGCRKWKKERKREEVRSPDVQKHFWKEWRGERNQQSMRIKVIKGWGWK